jgi:hypothetical protein
MGSFPVSDLGRLVIFVNKRRLLTEEIGSCMLTAHNGLPKYRHIQLVSLLQLLQLAHGQRDFTSSLHSAMVTSRKPMVHWDCYIAPTASRPSRVLDFQSRFGVYNAFSRAIRQSTSHWTPPRQLHRENTGHGAEATAQSPSNYTTVSCPHHVRLAYTKSRRRQALVPQYVSVFASELLRGLESFLCIPVRLLFTPTLVYRPLRLTFNMCFEAGYAAAANSASAADLRFLDEESEGDADKQGLPPICTGILTILRCCVSLTLSAELNIRNR